VGPNGKEDEARGPKGADGIGEADQDRDNVLPALRKGLPSARAEQLAHQQSEIGCAGMHHQSLQNVLPASEMRAPHPPAILQVLVPTF